MNAQITQVKQNTQVPTFEEVKNRTILVQWKENVYPCTYLFTDNLVGNFENCDWYDGLDWWTILSDEQQTCEYKKVTLGDPEETFFMPQCEGGYLPLHFDQFSFCPHCGLPIHIVDELKPLPLDEVMPKIIDHYNSESFSVEYEKDGWKYSTPMLESTEAAITAWNSLVKKLTGEK